MVDIRDANDWESSDKCEKKQPIHNITELQILYVKQGQNCKHTNKREGNNQFPVE